MTGAYLEVDETVLQRNIAAIQQHVAPAELMCVVKDDAYGLGLAAVVRAAQQQGVDWIGTYDVATALHTRTAAGEQVRIFAWATSTSTEVEGALRSRIDLGVGSADYLRTVIRVAETIRVSARVHLKIDTGLHRNGFSPEQWTDAVAQAMQAERRGVVQLVGVWSHLSEADDSADDASQLIFQSAVAEAQRAGAAIEHTHLTASAASWLRPELRGNLVRMGGYCYGVRSTDGPDIEGIVPAASLCAPVVAIADDTVTVAIGYLDGIPHTLAGRVNAGTPGGGQPVLAIDATTTTIQRWPHAHIGDRVVIYGPGTQGEPSPTTAAETIGTVGEEMMTRISPLLPRRYVVQQHPEPA
ncbi:alanine racemase [Microbacterium sp. YY-01]|uniref:alanine racemase n=1 Tax=Microbacterium sp. YY-01 TaxID=3421634 RepID=UPI003D17F7F7